MFTLRNFADIAKKTLPLLRDFSELFSPTTCYFCHRPLDDDSHYICHLCSKEIKPLKDPLCRQCGTSLKLSAASLDKVFCGGCLSVAPPYTKARFAAIYRSQFKQAIIDFKYGQKTHLSKPLGRILVQGYEKHFSQDKHEVIIPIPLHMKRLKKRGFNQSVSLASALSSATGIPVHRMTLVKLRDTAPQVSLDYQKRRKNLKASFSVSRIKNILDKRVLLVDDVTTTGTTIKEASRTLLSAGAKEIHVMVLALALGTDKPKTQGDAAWPS